MNNQIGGYIALLMGLASLGAAGHGLFTDVAVTVASSDWSLIEIRKADDTGRYWKTIAAQAVVGILTIPGAWLAFWGDADDF